MKVKVSKEELEKELRHRGFDIESSKGNQKALPDFTILEAEPMREEKCQTHGYTNCKSSWSAPKPTGCCERCEKGQAHDCCTKCLNYAHGLTYPSCTKPSCPCHKREERRCGKCNSPFLKHHKRLGAGDGKLYHTGCLPDRSKIDIRRAEVEKILWKHYDPHLSLNMEEIAGEIIDRLNTL